MWLFCISGAGTEYPDNVSPKKKAIAACLRERLRKQRSINCDDPIKTDKKLCVLVAFLLLTEYYRVIIKRKHLIALNCGIADIVETILEGNREYPSVLGNQE